MSPQKSLLLAGTGVRRVGLWNQSTEVDPSERAPMLVLQVDSAARRVSLNAGGDTFSREKDAEVF